MYDDPAGPTFTMDMDHKVGSSQFYSDFADLIQDDGPPDFHQQTPQDQERWINRFKYHLAGKGGDVEKCKKVPPAVAHQFGQNIEEFMNKKRKTQENYVESYGACDDVEREFDRMEELEARQQQKTRKGKKTTGIETFFPSSTTPGAQPTIKSVLQSKEIVKKCDIAIAKWMVDASVPFNAVNSAYYQPMIDAIANLGA
ncbi:hypothetical protein AHAS_Ahas19G0221400 [Arachis hypogaea]